VQGKLTNLDKSIDYLNMTAESFLQNDITIRIISEPSQVRLVHYFEGVLRLQTMFDCLLVEHVMKVDQNGQCEERKASELVQEVVQPQDREVAPKKVRWAFAVV
jgi:hypothetical protein